MKEVDYEPEFDDILDRGDPIKYQAALKKHDARIEEARKEATLKTKMVKLQEEQKAAVQRHQASAALGDGYRHGSTGGRGQATREAATVGTWPTAGTRPALTLPHAPQGNQPRQYQVRIPNVCSLVFN